MEKEIVPPVEAVHPVRAQGPTDKVAIVGFAETTRHLAPYDDPSYEIWGLNEEYIIGSLQTSDGLPRWDRWFQLHQRWDFSRLNNGADPQHFEWLQAQRPLSEGGFPIYMQARWDDIPASVPLDLDKLIEYSMGGVDGKKGYYTNTISILIAQAVLWGFKRIEVYGVEMTSGTEWAYQRPCTEYHIALARARGVEVIFPEICRITEGKLYGWEVGRMLDRMEIEMRLNALKQKEAETVAVLNKALGNKINIRKQLLDAGEDPMKSREYMAAAFEEQNAFAQAQVISGARQEEEHWIAILDNRYQPGQGPDDLPIGGMYRVQTSPKEGQSVAPISVDPT
jgi:hypothetical protein